MTLPESKQSFLYVACQHGAAAGLKTALCEPNGPFRLAYSARGFLTLKSALSVPLWSRALPEHPLIRARGVVVAKIEGSESGPMIQKVLEITKDIDWQTCHVWQRDIADPGWNGFEPGGTPLAWLVAEQFKTALACISAETSPNHPDPNAPPRSVIANRPSLEVQAPLDPFRSASSKLPKVLEIIIDEPNRWWIATKTAQQTFDYWPGGVPEFPIPEIVLSRAYLKIAEAFAWANLQIQPGEKIVEIGASPGGACQWLLDQGAVVTGVDPAEMDERILKHPNFTHWRSRSLQVKRKLFRPFRILVCDANVAPKYTLDTVQDIVNYPTTKLRALVLTIKFPEWGTAEQIPEYIQRVKSWGYSDIQVRQLAHNRREVCLVARNRVRNNQSLPTENHTDPQ
jgi:23S rRNA (cytidine2498-2'-O)-methyltransferase